MNNILKQADFLNFLNKTHNNQQKALLQSLSSQQLAVLCEILLNIVQGAIDINEEQKGYLRRRKTLINRILRRSTPQRQKRFLFMQNVNLVKFITNAIVGMLNKSNTQHEFHTAEVHPNPTREVQQPERSSNERNSNEN